MEIDMIKLLQDELVKDIPIIYVLNIVTAIENQNEEVRTILDKGQIKKEVVTRE